MREEQPKRRLSPEQRRSSLGLAVELALDMGHPCLQK